MALGRRFTLPMPRLSGLPLIGCVAAGFLVLGFLVLKAEAQPELRDVTLKDAVLQLGGQSCEEHIVEAESALLHLRGVVMVDIGRRKGYFFVGYDPSKVSIAQMLSAVRSRRGTDWFCTAWVEAG